MVNAPLKRGGERELSHDLIEEMPPRTVFHFYDPDIGIKADLAREIGFRVRLDCRLDRQTGTEGAIDWMGVIKGSLRRRAVDIGCAIEPIDLDEDRAGLIGATAAHRCEGALALATTDISGNPDTGFEAHGGDMPLTPAASNED